MASHQDTDQDETVKNTTETNQSDLEEPDPEEPDEESARAALLADLIEEAVESKFQETYEEAISAWASSPSDEPMPTMDLVRERLRGEFALLAQGGGDLIINGSLAFTAVDRMIRERRLCPLCEQPFVSCPHGMLRGMFGE